MRRTTVGASTGVLLLLGAALLAAPDGETDQGYVATGPAGDRSPVKPAPPTADVTLTPLDGHGHEPGPGTSHPGKPSPGGANRPPSAGDTGPDGTKGPGGPDGSNRPGGPDGTSTSDASESPQQPPAGHADDPDDSGSPADHNAPPDNGPPSDDPTPSDPPPSSPAVLHLSPPDLADTDTRWCEKVTLDLRNTGGRPVREGTLTFHTHIIGGLGIDWSTRKSTRALPTPIPAGETKTRTWKICVAAWRVPLGMHIDTKTVDAEWT
ncbi:hypothetical protein [Streptomyces niger]|uniref:hypothetical protein n=1 Tax=Streptomyces niger TaxID=66373 RepID=UPI00069AA47B|nr:hypothetical protein [Streptomyces niger]